MVPLYPAAASTTAGPARSRQVRLIAVDAIGLVSAVVIAAAWVRDRGAARPMVWNLSCWCTRIRLARVGAGYAGHKPTGWASG